jgi:acyl-coenzyme A thioesterase PaaI-like protein
VSDLDQAPRAETPEPRGPSSTGDTSINRAATAIRRISAMMVGQPLSDDALSAAAERLGTIADTLSSEVATSKRPRGQPNPLRHPADFFPTSPMIGWANPIAPPVEVWAEVGENGQREIRGRVTFDYPYEGPPTCVHGGVIAELFDELLGMSNIVVGEGAMTGTLTVRYRRPTPLLAPLQLVARHTGKEGRKVYAWGGIYHRGELTAEADGVFIEVPPGRMLDIVSGNAHSTEAPLVVDPDWQRMMARDGVKGEVPG